MTPADLSPEGLAALGRAIREDGWAGPAMCDPDTEHTRCEHGVDYEVRECALCELQDAADEAESDAEIERMLFHKALAGIAELERQAESRRDAMRAAVRVLLDADACERKKSQAMAALSSLANVTFDWEDSEDEA